MQPVKVKIGKHAYDIDHHTSIHVPQLQNSRYVSVDYNIDNFKNQSGNDYQMNLKYVQAKEVSQKRKNFLMYKTSFANRILSMKMKGIKQEALHTLEKEIYLRTFDEDKNYMTINHKFLYQKEQAVKHYLARCDLKLERVVLKEKLRR